MSLLDDLCSGLPEAEAELNALRIDLANHNGTIENLRADLANKTRQIQQYAENETEREKALMEEIAFLRNAVRKVLDYGDEWQKFAQEQMRENATLRQTPRE